MAVANSRVFVGRRRELDELSAAIDRAARGSGDLFLVVGESGIGKTCLAGEIAARAGERGITAIWGRCWEAEARPPYWPWVQLFRVLSRQRLSEDLAAEIGSGLAYLARMVPELRPGAPPSAPLGSLESESARSRLFDAAATLIRGAAAAKPLLLLLDDLHWADLPSLLLLEFVAGEVLDAKVLIIGTYRHVEARQEPAVAEAFARLARKGHHLALAGLSEPEVGLVIEMSAGRGASEAFVRAIHRETEGNPFFVDEVVRGCRAQSGDDAPQFEAAGVPISQGVRGAIRQRLAPLSIEQRALLAAAAVIGRAFEVPTLAGLCDLSAEDLLRGLSVPLEREIVARVAQTPGRYRFSHALIRETIYEELSPLEKTALHRRLARLLETHRAGGGDISLSELAHHFYEGALGGVEREAIDYAERAGRQAMDLLAYEEAVEQFRRAVQLLDLAPDALRQGEILLALGAAENRAGQSDEAMRTLDRAAAMARQHGSSTLLADAAIHRCELAGLIWTEFGRTDEALIRLLEEALGALGGEGGVRRARVLTRLATELCWIGGAERPEALSRDAVEIARAAGEAGTLAYALLGRILCVSGPDHLAERAAIVPEILALTEKSGDREVAVNALMWRVGDSLQLGDQATLRSATAALVQRVEALRQPADLWIIPTVHSQAALLEGRFSETEQLCQTIFSEPNSRANAAQVAAALLFLVRREQGRLDELEAPMKSLAADYPDVAVWRASLALLYAEVGREVEARAELDSLFADTPRLTRRDLTWLYSMSCLAEACAMCGEPAQARWLYAALHQYEGRNVVTGPFFYLGPVAYYLGLLSAQMSRWEEAAQHFEEGERRAAALGARPWLARILLGHARMCRARAAEGDREQAERMVERALAIAEPLGMGALCRRLEAEREGRMLAGPTTDATSAALLREGDFWTLVHEGKVHRLRDAKGFRYLAHLLQEPGRDFHVLDLVGLEREVASRKRPARPRAGSAALGAVGLLDAQAKRAYARRLEALRAEAEEAERYNDPLRAEKAQREIDMIARQLAGAVGLGGRDRPEAVVAERARASVTKAIRNAIRQIGTNDAGLSRALSRTVHTGTYCRYDPIAGVPLRWRL
jgi:tetratricopeptide (TPR) repeat protein